MFPPENAPTASFPYRIVGQVGTGSMGIVYKAVETELDRTVAIKVLRQSMLDEEPPQVQDELRRRILQEVLRCSPSGKPGCSLNGRG
jgi:serine/threonine protein kinase